MNNCILIGHIGRDVEVKRITSGKAMSNFTIGITTRWKDKQGKNQQKTKWIPIQAWDWIAERSGQLKKGNEVFISGEIDAQSWTDAENQPKTKTVVKATEVRLLAPRETMVDREQQNSNSYHIGPVDHVEVEKSSQQSLLDSDEIPF